MSYTINKTGEEIERLLNNADFSSGQQSAINSGITEEKVLKLDSIDVSQYPTIFRRLDNLEAAARGVLFQEQVDTSAAYQKSFPSAALPWAEINSIGGHSVVQDQSIVSAEVTAVESRDTDSVLLDTLIIPAEVQALDGYGWSAGSVYNEVDFVNKKFIKRIGKVDLGTMTWASRDIAGSLGFNSADLGSPISEVITAKYLSVYSNSVSAMTADKTLYYGHNSLGIVIKDSTYSDAAAFKAAMSGVYLYYELAAPVETDISAYLDDNAIHVEAGGTLTFAQNGTALPVPNSETYVIDLR